MNATEALNQYFQDNPRTLELLRNSPAVYEALVELARRSSSLTPLSPQTEIRAFAIDVGDAVAIAHHACSIVANIVLEHLDPIVKTRRYWEEAKAVEN